MIEFAAKNGDKSVLKEGIVNLKKAMEELRTLFQKELAAAIKPEKKKKRMDPLGIAIKLQNLKKEILAGTFIDTGTLEIFDDYTDDAFTVKMSTLKGHIDRFDTAEALMLIDTIMSELE
jgi:hypothetical protein